MAADWDGQLLGKVAQHLAQVAVVCLRQRRDCRFRAGLAPVDPVSEKKLTTWRDAFRSGMPQPS